MNRLETISLERKSGSRKAHDQVLSACCQECTVGCGLSVYVKDERIVDVQGDERHPVNKGRLCARGIAFVQGLAAQERITLPGTRNRLTAPFEAFDNWEKGIELLAERLRRVKEQHGAESLVIGCDPEAGLDFYLGAQRFARLWGTPHVYHPLQEAVDPVLPAELRHPTLESAQWSRSRCLMLIEADLAATHPVAFQRVLQAQRAGAKIIAVDARFTTTLAMADIAVLIAPDRGNDLGLALMKSLLEAPPVDLAAIEGRVKDFKAWKAAYDALPVESLAAAIGQKAEKIHAIGHALGRCQPAVLITGKRLAFARHYGIWLTMARVMGWHEKTGGGWYPLESGVPSLDPTVGLEEIQPVVSRCDSIAFSYQSNRLHQDSLDPMQINALIGSGNCLGDFLSFLHKRVNDLDLTVYFGSFPNRTRQAAHMVFPATAWAERDGINFTNDGTVQWSPRVVKPNDACRTGLGFWMRLAQRFGWDEYFPWRKANGLADQKAFYQWLFQNSAQTGRLQMDRIEAGDAPVYWRTETPEASRPEAALFPAPAAVDSLRVSGDPSAYPLDFQATRTMTHAGDASRWRPWSQELEAEMGIQINPVVARALAIENGETVIVASEEDIIEGPAAVTRMVPPRLVWSLNRMRADHVLVYRKGQAPEEARDRLKAVASAFKTTLQGE